MAYMLESVFRNSQTPFDVAEVVREELHELYTKPTLDCDKNG